MNARPARLTSLTRLATLTVIWLFGQLSPANAQVCPVSTSAIGGGKVIAVGPNGGMSDPELNIFIAPDLSSVRLENSEISVQYRGFDVFNGDGSFLNRQYAIKSWIIKSSGRDQLNPSNTTDYLGAGAGIEDLQSAVLIYDGNDRKTVRMTWTRWVTSSQTADPTRTIVRDISIFPHSMHLQVDYVSMRWAINLADLLRPGGSTDGVHIAHGGDDAPRGYLSHDEPPGVFYSRYGPDGVDDPADGGSLNYNGDFITAVYNPNNGEGFGRVMPVQHTHVIKLLLKPGNRRGLEFQNYPFLKEVPPFTGYMYTFTGGATEALSVGRMLADLDDDGTTAGECGVPVDITASPYTGWSFTGWSGDASGSTNPLSFTPVASSTVVANFAADPGLHTEDFESFAAGVDPAGWTDTQPNNSLLTDDALFATESDADGTYLATSSTETNIHSHLSTDFGSSYRYSGRMRMTSGAGGFGVTFFSQFPTSAGYYRLRRYEGTDFHISPTGTSISGGNTNTGVFPQSNKWYRFLVEVEDVGSQTNIRAKVWADGTAEPTDWQADAFDSSPTRFTSGTIGVWSFSFGAKHFDELAVHPLTTVPPTVPINASVVGSGTVQKGPDLPLYVEGATVQLNAVADPGWRFVNWTGDVTSSNNPINVIANAPSVNVTANFEVVPQHAIVLNTVGQGTVDLDPDLALFDQGSTVTATATPDPGWQFDGWSGDITSSVNPLDITVSGDLNLTATFVEFSGVSDDFESYSPGDNPSGWLDTGANNSLAENDALFSVGTDGTNQYLNTSSTATNIHSHLTGLVPPPDGYRYTGRMRMSADNGGIGVTFFSQFPSSVGYYRLRRYTDNAFHISPAGTAISGGNTDTGVVPSANVWYRFLVEVEDDGSQTNIRAKVWPDGTPEPAAWQADAFDSSPGRFTTGTVGVWTFTSGAKHFDDLAVTGLTPPVPTVPINASVVGNGTVQKNPDLPLYVAGATVELTAVADAGWRFVDWTGDVTSTDNPVNVAANAPSVDVTANFELITQHPVIVSTVGQGTVGLNPDLPQYDLGSTVTATATPDAGWRFVNWTGDITSTDNPLDVTIVAPSVAITANFEVITQHPIAVATVGQGTVDLNPDQPLHDIGSMVIATATADAGWQFDGWSGDITSSDNPLVITVPGDLNLTATFVEASSVSENFESYSAGDNPTGWFDTGAGNSLAENDGLFVVGTDGANKYLNTSSTATNIHSHLTSLVAPSGGYRYAGRMRMSDNNGGIGITFFSQFPTSVAYYRLRRYSNNAFHISPVGTSISGGNTDTGVVPSANVWYRYVVEVEDTGTQTNIRAKVWPDGSPEPTVWQVDAFDDNPGRFASGTVGVWSFSNGSKAFDDVTIEPLGPVPMDLELTVTTSGMGSVSVDPDQPLYTRNDVVELTATPEAGYVFAGWSGDVNSSANPLSVVMTGDVSLTASFVEPAPEYIEDFESYAAGEDPTDWQDTGSSNSLTVVDLHDVVDQGGTNKAFRTTSTATNIHSHYVGVLPDPTQYEYTGRMMMTSGQGGIGVTFFSQFGSSAAYYRLRRFFSNSFHISPVGTSVTGTTDTGVVPAANQWYRFKVQVEDTGSQTEIRAKVWLDGDAEPANWQADAVDASGTRLTSGTIGVWSFHQGEKLWDDLRAVPLSGLLTSTGASAGAAAAAGLDRSGLSGVASELEEDLEFALKANYPNPMRGSTTIQYTIPEAAHVTVSLYDALGQRVDVLVDAGQAAGRYSVTLNGDGLAAGVYFYRLEAGGNVATKHMVVVRSLRRLRRLNGCGGLWPPIVTAAGAAYSYGGCAA